MGVCSYVSVCLLWTEKAIFADAILAQGKNYPRKGQWARPDFGYGGIQPEKEAVRHHFWDCRNVSSDLFVPRHEVNDTLQS